MEYIGEHNLFIAVIGDIKESKKLKNRNEVQVKLRNTLQQLNEQYKDEIAAKFMITLGDEFQGLLQVGKHVVDMIELIQSEMYPVKLRFGIGVGQITTEINPEMAIGADGPGYYMAREAIETLKKNEQKNKMQTANVRIEMENDNQGVCNMLNTIFSLLTVIQNNWTERQREIIVDYEVHQGSQAECAMRLNITQSTVQRGLASANYYAYKDAKNTVMDVLKEIGERRV